MSTADWRRVIPVFETPSTIASSLRRGQKKYFIWRKFDNFQIMTRSSVADPGCLSRIPDQKSVTTEKGEK
jgi:hypothetical protein